MERKSRMKKRRKPKMRLELTNDVHKYITKRISDCRVNIITYLLSDPEIGINANAEDIKHLESKHEKVKNYGRKINTHRYKGEIILQEFPIGMSISEGIRFVSPYIKTK